MISVSEQTFNKAVLESPSLVLVHFWAPWCGLCRRITPVLSTLQTQWGSSLNLVTVNADENFKLANQYRLLSLPTLVLFNRGQVVTRIEHVHHLNALQSQLNQALRECQSTLTPSL